MSHNRHERGNSYIEFVLVSALFFVPLILGLVTVGISVIRNLQVNTVTRDVGHMLARGVNFAQQANQNIVANNLASGLGLVANSGNVTGGASGSGVLVLSIYQNLTAACGCPNAGHTVVVDRIVIGNNTLYTSGFGQPAYVDASTGQVANYSSDTGAIADNLSNVITISTGGLAYMCEGNFKFTDLGVAGFITNLGAFNRTVF